MWHPITAWYAKSDRNQKNAWWQYSQDRAITKACEREEADIIERSRTRLQNKGVTLEDLKHVKHTHDSWLHDVGVSAAFLAQA